MKFIIPIENYHVTDATLTIKALIVINQAVFFIFLLITILNPKRKRSLRDSSIDTENDIKVREAIMQIRYGNLVLGLRRYKSARLIKWLSFRRSLFLIKTNKILSMHQCLRHETASGEGRSQC